MVGPLLPDTSIWQWEYGLELHGHLHQEAGHLHQEAGHLHQKAQECPQYLSEKLKI